MTEPTLNIFHMIYDDHNDNTDDNNKDSTVPLFSLSQDPTVFTRSRSHVINAEVIQMCLTQGIHIPNMNTIAHNIYKSKVTGKERHSFQN